MPPATRRHDDCPVDENLFMMIGEIRQSLKDGEKRFERLETKVDRLNGINKKATTAGGITSGVTTPFMVLITLWAKEKLGL